MKSIKAIFRRGHKEGQTHQDNISRTSSITNLDSLEANLPPTQPAKGAKPKKTSSKEKIDKQAHDAKKVTKNNNKLEPPPTSGQPLSYSTDSLQDGELQQLRKQLKNMADEKSSLALQLGEQRGQLNVLQGEILKLKTFQEESNLEMEKLAEENTALRNRLRDVAHSPLSDNEKQQLLFESRHHSSAPASIATNVLDDNNCGDATTCTTPDWDKHSSGNVSEVSVACLQDKINQMQETHYSTNEELQATLQELTDLQRQLTELQQENERLNEEKTLMFDSLCRQTERLNDSRQEVDSLKQLLYRDRSDESGQLENAVEREQKLVELLRSAQGEREQLLIKLEQVQAELHEARSANAEKGESISQLSERVKTLECTLDAKHAEHKQLDQELAQAKDQCSGKQIEIDRLTDLLENARTKINELEQDRALSDKSELDELLDNARKEKDQLESEISYLKEQLARSKNEIEKLKEQVLVLQEECKVTRNNAKSTQSDLEYKYEKLASEKSALGDQLQQFQEAVNELQLQTQCHMEDKRQLSAVLSETQRNLSETERKNLTLENEIQELKKLRAEENDEWEKFQNDLLTSVRVANDFKTEAQQELQKIILENKTYRERVRLLEGQLEKLKSGTEHTSTPTQTDIILTPQIVSFARNFDPTFPARVSWRDRSSSPTTPTSSMEKLFPSLAKERKAKSKENLAEAVQSDSSSKKHKRQHSGEKFRFGLKKSKSKDDLAGTESGGDEGWEKVESEPKSSAGHKRSKSKENLAEVEKGSRGFLRWNKSKDNLEQLAAPPKEKKGLLKRNKSRDNLDQVKNEGEEQKSRKSVDSSSDSNKSEPKTEFLSKVIKKRDKKPNARSKGSTHQKFMSVEEEILLKSLDNWYGNIDQTVPDEFLTEEDRAIKKLKVLYEDEMLKEKPVAHKPKEKLAISKPLMQSVVQNPKLELIYKDPNLLTVDTEFRQSALEEVCSMAGSQTQTNIPKSKSPEEVDIFEEDREESQLGSLVYRSVEVDSPLQGPMIRDVSYNRMSSDILPTDSASNPRYSVLPKPNIYINYENLDEIVYKIPKGAVESKLTEEQKFALKLKTALDEREKEATLGKRRKHKKTFRGQEISSPTLESVQKNWKLKEILLNPRIRVAKETPKEQLEWKRHSTDICSDLGSPQHTLEKWKRSSLTADTSKSYEDISFSFVPENTLLSMFETEESESSFTSGEFNLDTGKIIKTFDVPEVELRTSDDPGDLLYNETINKAKAKENRQSKLLIEKMIKELSKQEEEDDDEIHHPKIIEAREKYKRELQMALRRLEHDELRDSLRKKRLKAEHEAKDTEKGAQVAEQASLVQNEVSLPKEKHNLIVEEESLRGFRGFALQTESAIYEVQITFLPMDGDAKQVVAEEDVRTKIEEDKDLKEAPAGEQNVATREEANSREAMLYIISPPLEFSEKEVVQQKNSEPTETSEPIDDSVEESHSIEDAQAELASPEKNPDLPTFSVVETHEPSIKIEEVSEAKIELPRPQDIIILTRSPVNLEYPVESQEASIGRLEDRTDWTLEEPLETKNEETLTLPLLSARMELPPEAQEALIKIDKFSEAEIKFVESTILPEQSSRSANPEFQDASITIEEPAETTLELPEHEEISTLPRFSPTIEYPPEAQEPSVIFENVATIHIEDVSNDAEYSHQEQEHCAEPDGITHMYITEDEGIHLDASNPVDVSYSTLKENRYGVISPLNLRHNYRVVVKEFKSKFPLEDLKEETPAATPDSESQNYLEYQNAFIDDFFKPVRGFEDSALVADVERTDDDDESRITAEDKSASVSQIDQEMQDIMDRYLHTTASYLVKSIDDEGLKKYEKHENLAKLVDEAEGWQVAKPAVVIEEHTATIEEYQVGEPEEDEPLSVEDMQFIEEMKRKYAGGDTISTSSDKSLDEDMEQVQKPAPKTQRSKKTRPLSEINDLDLRLIEEVTKREEQSVKPRESLIPVRKENPSKPLPPSLQPKRPSHLPVERPLSQTYSHVQMRDNEHKRHSHQSNPTKRLSDLIFTETIFVPMSKIPIKAPPSITPISPAHGNRETIFVSKKPESPSADDQNTEIRISLNRYSPVVTPTKWSNSLKKGLLDSPTGYEPVYSNVDIKPEEMPARSHSSSVKKPLPAPRYVTGAAKNDNTLSSNMTDPGENFSAVSGNQPEILCDLKTDEAVVRNDAQSQEMISVEESKAQTNILLQREVIGESCVEDVSEMSESSIPKPDELNTPVASTLASDKDVEEIPRPESNPDTSNVNLFHMDSPTSYDSYLELFKSKESKVFDSLTGKEAVPKNIFSDRGSPHVEELDSTEEDGSISVETGSKVSIPKVVDFVPLDDKTTPVFTKEQTSSSYDTLEREKTFHVLGQAATIAKGAEKTPETDQTTSTPDPPTSVELLARKSSSLSKSSSKSQTSTSFTQAKKIFEALTEANKDDRPKSAVGGNAALREGVRNIKSAEEVHSGSKEGISGKPDKE